MAMAAVEESSLSWELKKSLVCFDFTFVVEHHEIMS
jgi:hypothetical protein